jgi:lipoate-protein ligase A
VGETWRRLGPDALPPARAVARPVELLSGLAADRTPALSWSTVTGPALVLGRRAVDPEVDGAAVRAAGVEVVRRSSGGGPVLWDAGLLALDVALPRGHRLAGDDVVAAYRWLGEAIAEGLRALGVPDVEVVGIARARDDRARPGPAADACYGGLSPFEVTAAGRKVVGLSQTRRVPGALLQAGILVSLDPGLLARLLRRDEEFAAGLGTAAAGLGELRPGLSAAAIVGAVDAAVARRESVALEGTA